MMKLLNNRVKKIETIITATPKEGMSLDELKIKLLELGNSILEVNKENNYIKVLHVTKINEEI